MVEKSRIGGRTIDAKHPRERELLMHEVIATHVAIDDMVGMASKRNLIPQAKLKHLRFMKVRLHRRLNIEIIPHPSSDAKSEIIPTILLINIISIKHRTMSAIFRMLMGICISNRIVAIDTPVEQQSNTPDTEFIIYRNTHTEFIGDIIFF